MNFLSTIRVLLIGLWLGAACFFSFAVAPSAFAVLSSRDLAGSVVSRTLAIINISGLIISLILFASSFIKQSNPNKWRLFTERFLLLVLSMACAVGQFVIALWLAYIRSQIGRPIDEVAVEDPLRIEFNNLHRYSVWVLAAAMITALAAFFIIAKNPRRNNTIGIKQNVEYN